MKDFLERNDCDDCGNNLILISRQHRLGNRERHLLSRTDDLRSTYHNSASVHLRQHFTDASIDFFELNHIRLECSMRITLYWP